VQDEDVDGQAVDQVEHTSTVGVRRSGRKEHAHVVTDTPKIDYSTI
jgi:hypothetical protein